MGTVGDVISIIVLLFFLAAIIGLMVLVYKLIKSITGITDIIYYIDDRVSGFFERRKKSRFRFYVRNKDKTLIDIGYHKKDEDES